MPPGAAWEVFQHWGQKYGTNPVICQCNASIFVHGIAIGDLIYLEVLGKKMVVVNSSAAAFELLDKRSSIYSYRPRSTMANEV